MSTETDTRQKADQPLAVTLSEKDGATLAMVRQALQGNRIALALQPVVQAGDPNRIAYHEGLIRVLDVSGRPVPAREFIAAVEATDAGQQLDRAALALGLEALRHDPGLRLAVNMSARSIGAVGWMETLATGLALDDTVAERLILEITEASAMARPDLVTAFMTGLQRRGISFALDDFGAGQTSFRYFRDFSFDMVKIDRQFIANVHRNADNQILVRALVMIARQFDMVVVAEGVELAQEAAWLRQHGLDCLQGYLFGMPVTAQAPGRAEARRRA
ncbi:MAG: EAL domain-containing protein [Rhodobacter sp.]|nr:EAL domain-containing protein [Rhodobacter sp.]